MRVEERVGEVVADVLGRPFQPGERLDADSLSQAEVVLALEDAFGVRLPDDLSVTSVEEAAARVSAARDTTAHGDPLGAHMGRFQGAVVKALDLLLRRPYRLSVRGQDRIPRRGPAVLASNHDSLLDIPFLVIASPRPVWFMAKVELFTGPLASRFFREMGGFPVRRGGYDLRAIRAALDVVRRGRLLGMYPEGTRARHLQAFLPGAAWVALATGAPLVPVGVSGTADAMPRGSKLPRRTNVTVSFGEPLILGTEAEPRARLKRARETTEDLRMEVERLLARPSG